MLGLKDSKTQKHYNIILSPSMCQKIVLKNQIMVKYFYAHTCYTSSQVLWKLA